MERYKEALDAPLLDAQRAKLQKRAFKKEVLGACRTYVVCAELHGVQTAVAYSALAAGSIAPRFVPSVIRCLFLWAIIS